MNNPTKKLEEGGVVGLYDLSGQSVSRRLFYCLMALQHRGQTSCGMTLNNNNVIAEKKGHGMVGEILPSFNPPGNMGIGHVRYGEGTDEKEDALPLTLRYLKGTITLSLGGRLTGSDELKEQVENQGGIFLAGNDAEILAHLFAMERTNATCIEQSVLNVMSRIDGAFALVLMSPTKMMIYRDKHGFRPLAIGKAGECYIAASEDAAITAIGGEKIRDVKPGEMIFIDKSGMRSYEDGKNTPAQTCAYEYLYFARPDSVIDGISVYSARINAGRELFKSRPAEGDIVIGMPSSGLHFALGYARESGIPFGDAIIRNYYLARTHKHDSIERRDLLSVKLSVVKEAVEGKDIVLVDSSLISGITSRRMIQKLRDNGAKKVHLRIACPRFLSGCPFTDSLNSSLKDNSRQHIVNLTGADSVGFLPVSRLHCMGLTKDNCISCFKKESGEDDEN